MPYTTAVTDRVLSDITTPTSKGYFNVSDWTRIYRNAQLSNELAAILRGEVIVFNSITAPTITTVASVTDFNTLLTNIETLRAAVDDVVTGITTTIKNNYVAGIGQETFTFMNVNTWESTIDAIWTYYGGPALTVDRVLSADLTVNNGQTLIIVDSLSVGTYNVTINGTGMLCII